MSDQSSAVVLGLIAIILLVICLLLWVRLCEHRATAARFRAWHDDARLEIAQLKTKVATGESERVEALERRGEQIIREQAEDHLRETGRLLCKIRTQRAVIAAGDDEIKALRAKLEDQ